tara:strand:+ start:1693 stop:2376 length:684 start_codon:yes stop_codon:yes gene_type:complete
MARRKSQSNILGILILSAFAAIVLTIIITAWIVLGWLYMEIRYIKIRHARDDDFKLNKDEIDYIAELRKDKTETENSIQSILEEGKELSRRQDGFFSEKSNLGKELNQRLAPLIEDGKHYEKQINKMNYKPVEIFNTWKELRVKKLTYRYSFCVLMFSAVILYAYFSDYLIVIGEKVQQLTSILLPVINNELMGLIVLSTWVSFISLWLIQAILNRKLGNGITLYSY